MSALIDSTLEYIKALFKEEFPNTFTYHNIDHTLMVWENTKEIIENSEIDAKEAELVSIASLLHDIGYYIVRDGHEEESVKLAYTFLTNQDMSQENIETVCDLIRATKHDRKPENELEAIIKDADTAHVGTKDFNKYSELLRMELELTGTKTYTKAEWRENSLGWLTEEHEFYSAYAKKEWSKRKRKNIAKLMKAKLKKRSKKQKEIIKAKYKAKFKNESSERGIQTLFRVALRNHIKLSDIADTKANILLSVNAIIISLVLSNLISKLDNPSNQYMIVPTIIFVLFCIASIILSIHATRPNVTQGEFTKEDVRNKKVNLLFFGNFHKMELKDFEWAIGEMLEERDFIYTCLTKDLYFLGKVLNEKYRILRITYTIFTIGIIVSVIAFAISFRMQAT